MVMMPIAIGDAVKVRLTSLNVEDDKAAPDFKNVQATFLLSGENEAEHGQLQVRVVVKPDEKLDMGKVQRQAWMLLQQVFRDFHRQAEEAISSSF